MRHRRFCKPTLALLLIACCTVVLSACGQTQQTQQSKPASEGLDVNVGGVTYNVFISRELNIRDAEDQAYYQGPEAPPGTEYMGVFLRACNKDTRPHVAASQFLVRDVSGAEFKPLALAQSNLFAYRPKELSPGQCIPEPGTIASSGPTNGSLLVFQVPFTVDENRPLSLQVTSPPDSSGQPQTQLFELE
jgi:hypothetical protein